LPIDLPQLDIAWEPEQSAKAMVCSFFVNREDIDSSRKLSDRQKVLTSIRSVLHRVLILSHQKEEIWNKIHGQHITDWRRSVALNIVLDAD
jgi:hypothetical protein